MEAKSKLTKEYIEWLEAENKKLKQEVKELEGCMFEMEHVINEQRS